MLHSYRCKVLIVGSGGAALRAALSAAEILDGRGSVIVATKGEMGHSGVTANSCSDRMAFHATLPTTEPLGDISWQYHAQDIYEFGGCVSDWDLACILAKRSGHAFRYLQSIGVPFILDESGCPSQFVTDGSVYARACYTGPYTANDIERALVREVRKGCGNIELLEKHMVYSLIRGDRGEITGAVAIDEDTGGTSFIRADSVILATGGAGELFSISVYPDRMTGDGYSLAYRAGAELVNMEFIQFGLSSVKTKLACSGSIMRCIPRFINDLGKEFLIDYYPEGTTYNELYADIFDKGATWPVSYEHSTHMIDVAVYKEICAGRRVYLDFSANPSGLRLGELPPSISDRFVREAGARFTEGEYSANPLARLRMLNQPAVDWLTDRGIILERGDMIELAPAAQHFQGGIKIDSRGATNVAGLFACGEAAGGQHGANRPGGNALMDCQVFGEIAGRSAALHSLMFPEEYDQQPYSLPDIPDLLGTDGIPASEVRRRLQDIIYRSVGVVRVRERIARCTEAVRDLRARGVAVDNSGTAYALETCMLVDIAECLLLAAGARTESRGPHLFFKSFDDRTPVRRLDPDWQKYIVLKKDAETSEPNLDIRRPIPKRSGVQGV